MGLPIEAALQHGVNASFNAVGYGYSAIELGQALKSQEAFETRQARNIQKCEAEVMEMAQRTPNPDYYKTLPLDGSVRMPRRQRIFHSKALRGY